MQTKLKIPFLAFWVGTKCTLKCQHCCNLIPYIRATSYEIEKSLRSFRKLLEIADIESLQIQGGEPFTHPHIDRFITEMSVCGRGNTQPIIIASNGVCVLNDQTIKALQSNENVVVRISKYKCSTEIRNKFIKKLEEHGINYTLYDCRYNDSTWFNSGGPNEKYINDDAIITKIYEECTNRRCYSLSDGILSVCGKILSLKELHGVALNEWDYVDFNKNVTQEILRKDLQNFLNNSNKLKESCRYCLGTYGKVPAGKQIGEKE